MSLPFFDVAPLRRATCGQAITLDSMADAAAAADVQTNAVPQLCEDCGRWHLIVGFAIKLRRTW